MKRTDFKFEISDLQGRRSAAVPLIVAAVLLGLFSVAGFGAQQGPAKPLADGTILTSVDGKLIAGDGGAWLFELIADANSVRGVVTTGTRFELLPSATLERLIADVNDRYAPLYRLSARVTRFRGRSFLFPIYFLPLSKLKSAKPPGEPNDGPQALPEAARNGRPDSELAIPPEVAERLKSRRMVRGPQREGGKPRSQTSPDRTIVDAIGRIEPAAGGLPDSFVFVVDAFGWNISGARYELLPCAELEQALRVQAASPESIRFNIAGLVTEFKGKQYLLLQRAIRAYGHGNFVR